METHLRTTGCRLPYGITQRSAKSFVVHSR